MNEGALFIRDLAVILVAAGVFGWICQKVKLSVVVGYILAGILVGPHTLPGLMSSAANIETAGQVGLVFLIFSIGLKLSLRRLKAMGLPLLLAALLGAGFVYYLTRVAGGVVGWTGMETLFLAGMLMVSSSAIIGKVVQETGTLHEKSSQLAMGLTVLEDVVAIIMLTILGSMVKLDSGGGAAGSVGATLGWFVLFVVFVGAWTMVGVPWLLRRMSFALDDELQTLGMCALLFGVAFVAFAMGYSLALGAFLLGIIVAETPQRFQVDRVFTGMRDVFSAVFFVTIGMQIDLMMLEEVWLLVIGVTGFTFLVRITAVSTALVLTGSGTRDALRAGMTATPIGEFSFIIAQLGVASKVVPERFYPMAVGLSLLTCLLSPMLTKHSVVVSGFLVKFEPKWLSSAIGVYHGWLEGMGAKQSRNLVWILTKKRLLQVGVLAVFLTGLMLFAPALLRGLVKLIGADYWWVDVAFWLGVGFFALMPLVALWRNVSAMALVYAEVITSGQDRGDARNRMRGVIVTVFRFLALGLIWIWLTGLLPARGEGLRWVWLVNFAVLIAVVILLRRKLVYWGSGIEVEMHEMLGAKDTGATRRAQLLAKYGDWHLQMGDCVLPDLAACRGVSLRKLNLRALCGCSIVGVERQGVMMLLPKAEEMLYPRDRVLLMGTQEQILRGTAMLERIKGEVPESSFDDVSMEVVEVPEGSAVAGVSLQALGLAQKFSVSVVGLNRVGGERVLNPRGEEVPGVGDELLVMGTGKAVKGFREWMAG